MDVFLGERLTDMADSRVFVLHRGCEDFEATETTPTGIDGVLRSPDLKSKHKIVTCGVTTST